MKVVRKRLHHIFSQSTFHFEELLFEDAKFEKKLKFPFILIDISKYDDPRLLQGSLHLLNRYSYNCGYHTYCNSSFYIIGFTLMIWIFLRWPFRPSF